MDRQTEQESRTTTLRARCATRGPRPLAGSAARPKDARPPEATGAAASPPSGGGLAAGLLLVASTFAGPLAHVAQAAPPQQQTGSPVRSLLEPPAATAAPDGAEEATQTASAPEAEPLLRELAPNSMGHRLFERSTDGALMVLVPGGSFRMGSAGAGSDARPARRVRLPAYLIDEHEATWRQLTLWMKDTGGLRKFPMPTWLHDESHPIVNATWDLAEEYCLWAGGRLPTEAEWEHAARGEDERTYPWGDEFDPGAANWKGGDDPWPNTAPVRSMPGDRSPFGLFDMGGNVTEWVADWYSARAYASGEAQDPTGPKVGTKRVYRGGNWNHTSESRLSTTRRGKLAPDTRYATFGFRCAMDLPEDAE